MPIERRRQPGLTDAFAALPSFHGETAPHQAAPSGIEGDHPMDLKLEVVVIPVSDVDRSKAFYADKLGFVVDVDQSFGDAFRIVQLTPPGSACSVTIGKGLNDAVPGSVKGMQLVVADIAACREELVGRGLDVTPVRHNDGGAWIDGPGGPWNSFIFFDDPDGNSWTIQEKPADA
jgi:catechol 2,3-dioxygenase-like lactoylglutathione lyase family enzyme